MELPPFLLEQLKKHGLSEVQPFSNEQEYLEYQMNIFNDDGADNPNQECTICHDKGRIAVIQNNEVKMRECVCVHRHRIERRLKKAEETSGLKFKSFDDFKVGESWQQSMLDAGKSYAAKPSGWFFIGGQIGCGKTHICSAIMKQCVTDGIDVFYLMWPRDSMRLMGSQLSSFSEMDSFIKAQVLYIDDFLRNPEPSRGELNIAFQLLNSRYNSEKPTLFSSEKSLANIIDIDEAIGTRIAAMCKNNNIFISPDKHRNYRSAML